MFNSFKAFIKPFVFHAGVQTQTYRQVCVVLFTKGRDWEIMATTYQRQDKGNAHSLKTICFNLVLQYCQDSEPLGQMAKHTWTLWNQLEYNDHIKYRLSQSLQLFPQCNWLSVDFINWKDWEDDSDEDLSSFDKFSEVSLYSTLCLKYEYVQLYL